MLRVSVKCAFVLMLVLSWCPTEAPASDKKEKNKPRVGRVEVKTVPSGYPLIIDGKPAGITYDPARPVELPPGKHTVEVIFPNDKRWSQEVDVVAGKRYCICLRFTKRVITKPCPYPVSVSAPTVVNDGDMITFAADVAYGGTAPLNYTWAVSPASARIMSGAGTPTITVDSTGVGKQPITATLVVDDGSGDPACRQMSQVTINVLAPLPPPVVAREFDEFPSISFDDDKARLDNLVIELQNTPNAVGHIIVYAGRRSRPGQAERLGARAQDYLVRLRGVDPNRLRVINGGYRERDSFELWIVPQGAEPPRPTPTLRPDQVQPGTGVRLRRARGREQ